MGHNSADHRSGYRRFALGLSLTGAILGGMVSSALAGDASPITIGVILPLTGPASPVGNEMRRGLELAQDELAAKGGIAGHPVKFAFEDNQARPDLSVIAFNKLTSIEDAQVIFSAMSGPTLAIAPLATRKRVLEINAGAQADALNTASPYLFNTLPTVSREAGILAKYLVEKGMKTAGILYENAAAGEAGRDGFAQAFEQAGGKVIGEEPAQFGQADFRPPLLKLVAANPEVIFASVTVDQLELAQQYRQLAGKAPLAGTTLLYSTKLLSDPAASNGLIYSAIHIEAPKELNDAYKARFGADMPLFAKQYYNASQMIFSVMEGLAKENKEITGDTMRAYILEKKTFQNLVKLIFNSNTAETQLDIKVMQDGKSELVTSVEP